MKKVLAILQGLTYSLGTVKRKNNSMANTNSNGFNNALVCTVRALVKMHLICKNAELIYRGTADRAALADGRAFAYLNAAQLMVKMQKIEMVYEWKSWLYWRWSGLSPSKSSSKFRATSGGMFFKGFSRVPTPSIKNWASTRLFLFSELILIFFEKVVDFEWVYYYIGHVIQQCRRNSFCHVFRVAPH